MLMEGVPPAMIENSRKMAGMPVGPLALSDEVAHRSRPGRSSRRPRPISAPSRSIRAQKKLIEDDGGKAAAASAARTARASTTIPQKRARRACGRASPIVGARQLEPDTVGVEELKKRFLFTPALEAARCMEEGVVTDPREADVGSILGFGFAPYTGGTLSYHRRHGAKAFVGSRQGACGELWAALRSAREAR